MGYETPIQKDGYDSDQDRDTELIRRRETDDYESGHGGKTPSPYGQNDDGRSYIPGVGVGYETPLQQSGCDSDQDKDTDFIRRRETGGYESGQSQFFPGSESYEPTPDPLIEGGSGTCPTPGYGPDRWICLYGCKLFQMLWLFRNVISWLYSDAERRCNNRRRARSWSESSRLFQLSIQSEFGGSCSSSDGASIRSQQSQQ